MIQEGATTPEREHRAGALFLAAAELEPAGREGLLAEVGRRDPALRAEVEALLEADRRNSDGFLRAPMAEFSPAEPVDATELPRSVGPYEVVRELGRGEHAAVYLARQRQPVERDVAIKVLRSQRASRDVLRRFETERRILALMDHPNITRFFEAGVTPEGHAYFVMEWVRGGPISSFCRERSLTIRQRLELFCDVCRAVEHAHQRGIIHRDLKPTNVLVAPGGDAGHGPMVKVIDFGVARASGAGLYSFPSHTLHGQMVGTIAYMSPEQIGGDGLLVDTRSDVYGLGAVLYETICDVPAFDTGGAGPATVITRITLQGPPAPREVRRSTPRDVDAMIRRAMERDPARRYQTVAALRGDIERYLAGRAVEPLAARPLYVARKFAMRHRVGVAMLLVLAALLTGMAVRDTIEQRKKFDLAVNLAQAGFDQSRVMAKTAGERGLRRPLLVVLETQSKAMLDEAPDHRGVLHLRADVLGARGDLYLEEGDGEQAGALFEEALAIRDRLVALDNGSYSYRIERSISTVRLGDATRVLRRDAEAERFYLRAMVMDEQLYAARPGMPRAITLLAWSCDRLASYAAGHKDMERADGLYARCLELMERLCTLENSADAHRGLCTALVHRGDSLRRHGDEENYRVMIVRALDEANTAVSLSPTDRLARWAQISARSAFLDSRAGVIPPTDAMNFALETLGHARTLADMDPSDYTMRAVLTRAMISAAELAEACGDMNKALAMRDELIQECRRTHELHPSDHEAGQALEDAINGRNELLERLPVSG